METKQSRKELEREVALGMFCVRVAEMKADWLANRYESLFCIIMVLCFEYTETECCGLVPSTPASYSGVLV
jgi:hypothetical protein